MKQMSTERYILKIAADSREQRRTETAGTESLGKKTTLTKMLRGSAAGVRFRLLAGTAFVGFLMTSVGSAGAQATPAAGRGRFGIGAPATYDNRYEVYGGLNFMNFQAGQNLPKRMNLAGGEILGTYWLTNRVGLGADFRGEAGTTPVFPNQYNINRALAYQMMGMLGAQFRGPKNRYAALNVHAYAGVSHGVFDSATNTFPNITSPTQIGLYNNKTKPVGAVGASIDFNYSKNLAIRLQPDLMLEHFGTETRQFFAISAGAVYRFGKR